MSKMPLTTIFLSFLALLLASYATADFTPENTQPAGEEPPAPEEASKALNLPDGFHASLFAGEPEVRQPIALDIDPRGRLWVAESYSYYEWKKKGQDRILILEDTDGDGVHDSRRVFWSGGNHVSGMVIGFGGVWVCDSPNLIFIPDKNHDDIPDGEPEIILDGWTTTAKHNFFNGLTWGIDGWLYGRHGITNSSKVGPPGSPAEERADVDCSIWRYHPVKRRFEVVCRGTTNPWGLDWNDVGEMFFTNNVNGHLWHAIPGAYYPRMRNHGPGFGTHIYDRIQMCADHLHHAGSDSDWTKSRDGKGVHGQLGGGHSHCGGMIYLGGNWPDKYSNSIFMANTHGRRLNRDSLERHGSGYVGKHLPDFMTTDNLWFKGVSIHYGPDGNVFLSDWCDNGECHDSDGVHRTSGRIYKISYGEREKVPAKIDLWSEPSDTLAKFQTHPNEWFARTARRILQHRKVVGAIANTEELAQILTDILTDQKRPTQHRIRALLTLHVLEGEEPGFLLSLLSDSDEYVRAWAVRLLCEDFSPTDGMLEEFAGLAGSEDSSLVRLYLASCLQKIPGNKRWAIAEELSRRIEDTGDHNIPLMLWYAIKDIVHSDPIRSLEIARSTKFNNLPQFICRRLAEGEHLEPVLAAISAQKDQYRFGRMLAGVYQALEGRKDLAEPEGWKTIASRALESGDQNLWNTAVRITSVFDARRALTIARQTLADKGAPNGKRETAIALLANSSDADSIPAIIQALDTVALRPAAIRGLARFTDRSAAEALVARFADFDSKQRSDTVVSLTSNRPHARVLIDAMASGKIPHSAVTAFHARRIHALKEGKLIKEFSDVWGSFSSTQKDQMQKIRFWENQLRPDVLAGADIEKGRTHYQTLCSACHSLHGSGGNIGPDLTGANRDNLYYLLENIIAPNASLPKDYRMTTVNRNDGNVITGNIAGENEYTVTLRTLTGEETINRKDIKSMETTDSSVMPAGLLETLDADAVRDLIGFLQKP